MGMTKETWKTLCGIRVGDMKDPKAEIPRAIILGGAAIAFIYLFASFGIGVTVLISLLILRFPQSSIDKYAVLQLFRRLRADPRSASPSGQNLRAACLPVD